MKGTKTLTAWSFDIHMNLNIMNSIRQLAHVNWEGKFKSLTLIRQIKKPIIKILGKKMMGDLKH